MSKRRTSIQRCRGRRTLRAERTRAWSLSPPVPALACRHHAHGCMPHSSDVPASSHHVLTYVGAVLPFFGVAVQFVLQAEVRKDDDHERALAAVPARSQARSHEVCGRGQDMHVQWFGALWQGDHVDVVQGRRQRSLRRVVSLASSSPQVDRSVVSSPIHRVSARPRPFVLLVLFPSTTGCRQGNNVLDGVF